MITIQQQNMSVTDQVDTIKEDKLFVQCTRKNREVTYKEENKYRWLYYILVVVFDTWGIN